jgi:DNA helicase-2/ATP-dependent DNA helicase PcrA
LNLANKVISCNKERIGKALFTEKDSGDMPYVRIFSCREEEVKFVVSCIKKEKDLNETAMLYRNQYLSRLLERELILERIPYRLLGGVGFFERKEIKDILSFMRILVNDGDGVSFLRSASCIPHIGEKTCLQVERLVREEKISYIEAASRQKKKEMKNYAHIMKKLQEVIYKKGKIGNFFKELLQQTGYLEQLKNDEERKRNIREFTDYAISSMEDEGLTVKDFLKNIALLGYKRNRLRDEKDAVNLTTIHSAKGLEFDTVFIIDVDENILPSKRSLEEGIYSSSLEEERRLLYVAITRARKKVFILSGGRPSVFMLEIGKRQNIRWL